MAVRGTGCFAGNGIHAGFDDLFNHQKRCLPHAHIAAYANSGAQEQTRTGKNENCGDLNDRGQGQDSTENSPENQSGARDPQEDPGASFYRSGRVGQGYKVTDGGTGRVIHLDGDRTRSRVMVITEFRRAGDAAGLSGLDDYLSSAVLINPGYKCLRVGCLSHG